MDYIAHFPPDGTKNVNAPASEHVMPKIAYLHRVSEICMHIIPTRLIFTNTHLRCKHHNLLDLLLMQGLKCDEIVYAVHKLRPEV